jgi:hypothetical protein
MQLMLHWLLLFVAPVHEKDGVDSEQHAEANHAKQRCISLLQQSRPAAAGAGLRRAACGVKSHASSGAVSDAMATVHLWAKGGRCRRRAALTDSRPTSDDRSGSDVYAAVVAGSVLSLP